MVTEAWAISTAHRRRPTVLALARGREAWELGGAGFAALEGARHAWGRGGAVHAVGGRSHAIT